MTREPGGAAHRLIVVRLVSILLVLGLAACGEGTDVAAGGPLTGRTFLSESVAGHDLVAGTQLRVDFREDEVSVTAGCNSLFGNLRIEGDRLFVEDMGGTEMGCDPERHDQDVWITELLGSGPSFELDGDRLRLTAGDVVVTLLDREVADPDRPLDGTTWVLDGLIEGDAVSSVPVAAETTLVFDGGRVAVRSCNQGSAPVSVEGDELEIGALAMTRMACEDDRMDVESHVTAVLDGRITYAIEATRLTLTHPDGKGLVLRAQP